MARADWTRVFFRRTEAVSAVPAPRLRRIFESASVNAVVKASAFSIRLGSTRPTGAADGGGSETGATEALRPNTATAAFMAASYPFAVLRRAALKSLVSKNDGVEAFMSSASPFAGRIGVDLDKRLLNSTLKGRTVWRIGSLGAEVLPYAGKTRRFTRSNRFGRNEPPSKTTVCDDNRRRFEG